MSNKLVQKLSKTYSINKEIVTLILEYKNRYDINTLGEYYSTVSNGYHKEYIIRAGNIIRSITSNKIKVDSLDDHATSVLLNNMQNLDYNRFIKYNGIMNTVLLWDNTMRIIITNNANV